jgi:hypothetical protein
VLTGTSKTFFMNSFLSKFGISKVVLILFLTIMALIFLYFFVTLDKNQEALEKRGYRTLEKLENRMKQRDKNYTQVAKSRTLFYSNLYDTASGKNPKIANGRRLKRGKKNNLDTTTIKLMNKTWRGQSNISYVPGISGSGVNLTLRKKGDNPGYDTVNFSYNKDSVWQTSFGEFLSPLIRRDFFSNYLFFKDSKIIFSTLSDDLNMGQDLSGPGKSNGNSSSGLISVGNRIIDAPSLIEAGTIKRVTIQGTSYLLFQVPVNFHNNSKCYLGGLIEESKFIQTKRSLPSGLIAFFIFILLLIFFSFPILKGFIMGPRESLSRAEVSMRGISLATGTLILCIILTQNLIGSKLRSDHYRQLNMLNESVKQTFINERDTILKQMEWYDTNKSVILLRNKVVNSILDMEGVGPVYKRPVYPFFKSLFWADTNGIQLSYLTPFNDGLTSPVFLRAYFIHPDKYPYFDPNKSQVEKKWYSMEPIYTQSTGEWSMAFSMPSVKKKEAKIIAMTSAMCALKFPALQKEYEYFLIDKTGLVWHHSGEVLDLSDNFLTECNNNESLASILYTNDSDSIPLEIRGQNYLACITPIDQTDLFVVTVMNPARANSLATLTGLFVLAFFTVAFLILFLYYIILKLSAIRTTQLAGKTYFFRWLLPDIRKQKAYTKLIQINGVLFVLFIVMIVLISLNYLSIGATIAILILFMLIHSSIVYITLNSREDKTEAEQQTESFSIPSHYPYFIVSWLLIGVILPVILLTHSFFSNESTYYILKQQHYLAQKINDRTESFHQFYKTKIPSGKGDSLFLLRNERGNYYKVINSTDLKPDTRLIHPSNIKESGLLKLARNWYNIIMDETDTLSSNPLTGVKYRAVKGSQVSLVFSKTEYDENGLKSPRDYVVTTRNLWTGIFNPFRDGLNRPAIIFWISIMILILLLVIFTNQLVKMFIFPVERAYIRPPLLPELRKIKSSGVNAVFISYDQPEKKVLTDLGWTLTDIGDKSTSDISVVGNRIVLNFEEDITSLENFSVAINLLEKILSAKPVVLWLDKTPEQLIEKYKEEWGKKDGSIKSAPIISQFMKLVSGMPRFYPSIDHTVPKNPESVPPDKSEQDSDKKDAPDPGICKTLAETFEQEKKFNPDIQVYELLIKQEISQCCSYNQNDCREYTNKGPDFCSGAENLILKIQDLSTSFYDYVWDSLSNEEKIILLDLAQDTVLNLKNRKMIIQLLQKGILQMKDQIGFVSPSFKNFILTQTDKSTFEELQAKSKEEGTWTRIRNSMILVAASLVVFLIFTQQNLLSNMNTVLLSAGTLVGVYLKFSGLFKSLKGN